MFQIIAQNIVNGSKVAEVQGRVLVLAENVGREELADQMVIARVGYPGMAISYRRMD